MCKCLILTSWVFFIPFYTLRLESITNTKLATNLLLTGNATQGGLALIRNICHILLSLLIGFAFLQKKTLVPYDRRFTF